ncbi:transporter substrate-binding domain-containing protein [Parapedobacter sp.]
MRYLFIAYILFLTSYGYAQPDEPLTIGVAGSPPFVLRDSSDNSVDGISIQIWERVANDLDLSYTYRYFEDVPAALTALRGGQLDVVVGPTTITSERAAFVRFSQPYFQSSLSILSNTEKMGLWDRIRPFFSLRLLYAVLVFMVILGCVGMLLWLVERRKSPQQFPPEPARGIANGMWCAIVTMSTTGYGDLAPVTFIGRVIAGCWMVISIIFATSMVAGIASTLTLTGMAEHTIETVEDMYKKKIAVVSDSPADDLVAAYQGISEPVRGLEEGYRLLGDKKVQAMVFDRPQLLYFLNQKHQPLNSISAAEYEKQGYGFAFSAQTSLLHDVNIHLLHLQEDGTIGRIVDAWLGTAR